MNDLHAPLFCSHEAFRVAVEAIMRSLGKRKILLRPSEGSDSIAIRSSRSRGRILRPSVVRSTTGSAASVLIDIGPWRLSLERTPYWVVRNPAAPRYRS